MKYLIQLFIIFVFLSNLSAQEETLVGYEMENGDFGGPDIKLSTLNDKSALFIGGKGGWIINHTFVIGGAGYGLVNNIATSPFHTESDYSLTMGYGGLYLEYIHNSDKLFHFTIHSLIGGGGAQYRKESSYNPDQYFYGKQSAFFVLEPGVSMMLNITQYFRLGLGLNYRYISGLDMEGLSSKELSAPSATITFKFGSF